jgi:hypothetical protein
MPKVPISTRVEEALAKRLERVATVDRRTIANIIEICVEEYLPQIESELDAKHHRSSRSEAHAIVLNDAPTAKYPVQKKRSIAKEKEN